MTAAVFDPRFQGDSIADRADDYRRQARRLRHILRREPVKLHRSLRYLSACHDLVSRASRISSQSPVPMQLPRTPEYVIDQTSHTIRDFANDVVKSMRGPILSYSQRLILMRKAKQIGLRPFDANLIIAAVQHRVNETIPPEPIKPISWKVALIVGSLLQLGIVAGVWWILQ